VNTLPLGVVIPCAFSRRATLPGVAVAALVLLAEGADDFAATGPVDRLHDLPVLVGDRALLVRRGLHAVDHCADRAVTLETTHGASSLWVMRVGRRATRPASLSILLLAV
jgi:hypothetical protein